MNAIGSARSQRWVVLVALVVAGAAHVACPSPRWKQKDGQRKGSARGSAKGGPGAASGGAGGAAASGRAAAPTTAAPAAGAPARARVTYDPANDPANAGGFSFADKRAPDDPRDAKKKPVTIRSLYEVAGVGSPVFSPDGKWLLFTVTRHTLSSGKSNTDIYRVRPDGSELRRMTHHPASDSGPAWAPDGRSFVFVSGRRDGAQLWRMFIDGGEPEKLSAIKTGVSAPRFTPDGKSLVFVSRVFPEHGADQAKNKALSADIKQSTVKAHVADDLLYRHWTFYKDGRRAHILRYDLATKKLEDLTPGDFDTPAFGEGSHGFDISPDGKELCFVSNREKPSARAYTTNKDLFVVSLQRGPAGAAGRRRPRNITESNKAYDGQPRYSPDGRFIAFSRQGTPGYESAKRELALYDRKTGKVRLLSAGFDNWVMGFSWRADSRSLVFKGAQRGRFPLFSIALADGRVRKLAAMPSARAFDVSRDGRVAFTFTSVGRPAELFVSDAAGAKARRLSYFNKLVVERYDLRPVEERTVAGVHAFIVKPHGFKTGRRYPLIINVHGGPQYQWTDRWRGDWQVYPARGYVVAFFNPTGSIGYGQKLTAAISKDWGGRVYKEVMAVTEALAKLPFVDGKRVGAMGWSYGGYMMAWLLGHTQRFKAIAAMMPLYDLASFYGATEELWFPEWDLGGTPWTNPKLYVAHSPSTFAKKFKTPTLVITGERDYRVPYTQGLQLFTALRRQGVPARLVVFKNDGHWPAWVRSMPLYYAAHVDWFARYLGGQKGELDVEQLVRGRGFKAKKIKKVGAKK